MGCVAAAFVMFVIVIIIGANSSTKKSLSSGQMNSWAPGTQFARFVANGAQARGILLRVAPTGTRFKDGGQTFERRFVRLDVEIPGQAPYEIDATPIIPTNLVADVLPGATLELRVDRSNGNIAIVGSGVGMPAPPSTALPRSS